MGESFSTAERGALPLKGLMPAIFPPEMQKMESFHRRDMRRYRSPTTRSRLESGAIHQVSNSHGGSSDITKRPFAHERFIKFYGSLILSKM